MAVSVASLRAWLEQFARADGVGIDDGGLCLRLAADPDNNWFEIGGIPTDFFTDCPRSATRLDLTSKDPDAVTLTRRQAESLVAFLTLAPQLATSNWYLARKELKKQLEK